MSLYSFNPSDKLPKLEYSGNIRIEKSNDPHLLSSISHLEMGEIKQRFADNHIAFVAWFNDQPAAFGWMATRNSNIGELNHAFHLPVGHRYLWNFRTLSDFRGLGIYPLLLQYIIRYERQRAEKYWIIHAPENLASKKGIRKAGFSYVGELFIDQKMNLRFNSPYQAEQHKMQLTSMGFKNSDNNAPTCWNCSNPYLKKRSDICCCVQTGAVCVNNRIVNEISVLPKRA